MRALLAWPALALIVVPEALRDALCECLGAFGHRPVRQRDRCLVEQIEPALENRRFEAGQRAVQQHRVAAIVF